jgi:uncharacterized protein with FMN-binding domain
MALSSAAVLTVYTAGYFRTKAAAARFAHEAADRRPVAAMPEFVGAPDPPVPVESSVRQQPVAEVVERSEPERPAAAASTRPAPAMPATPDNKPAADIPAVAPAESSAVTAPAVPAVGFALETTTAAHEAKAVESAPAPQAPAPAIPPGVAAVAAAAYKDGTYYGWGWCRHGQIQAAVVIEAGRIASATIAQCLTRYSCSWIAQLPPQVAKRQSAEVDYVSGATESTNAFYYAVVDALAKAK